MLTFLKFYADWCVPCKNFAPVVEQLKDFYDGKVIFTDVNIEDNPQLRVDYHIRSLPTVVLVRDGKEVDRKIGSENTFADLREWIDGLSGDLQS